MAAPAVSNLQDVIASLTAANQPLLQNMDQQDQNISAAGTAGAAGVNAAKDAAFGDITANASNRGALFSGFTPDAEAKYTSSTYLPALAKLQQSILESRTALAGQRAQLTSGIATRGIDQVQGEKTALQQWQEHQDELAAQNAQQEKILGQTQSFQAGQSQADREAQNANLRLQIGATAANAAADRAASSAKVAAQTPTAPQALASLFNATNSAGTLARNDPGYTEKVIIPTIAQDYGLSMADAATAAYQFRKKYYGN